MIFFMLTNILSESTEVLFVGDGAKELLEDAFNIIIDSDTVMLKGVVSRKKQFIPPIFESLGGR